MMQNYKRVLVAIDGSKGSEVALAKAIETVKNNEGSTLDVLRVLDLNSLEYGGAGIALDVREVYRIEQANEEYMFSLKQKLVKENGLNEEAVHVHLRFGNPKLVIAHDFQPEYSNDLILVGSTGKNFFERLVIGSVASYVIRNASCDVLMARN